MGDIANGDLVPTSMVGFNTITGLSRLSRRRVFSTASFSESF